MMDRLYAHNTSVFVLPQYNSGLDRIPICGLDDAAEEDRLMNEIRSNISRRKLNELGL